MSQAHVVVLMGGRSLEHEVSMAGGTKVAANIDRERFRVTSVVIGKDGRWAFPGRDPMPLAQAVAALAFGTAVPSTDDALDAEIDARLYTTGFGALSAGGRAVNCSITSLSLIHI